MVGVQKIQEQLEAIHMEIQNLQKKRGKDGCADIWCIRCRVSGHTKDQCPLLMDYMQVGGPSPIRPGESRDPILSSLGSRGPALWCDDYWVAGLHDTNHCPLLGAYVPELKQQWCRFCQKVGHDEQNWCTYDLMMDCGNLFRVQSDPASPRISAHLGGSLADRGGRGGSVERGRVQLICYNCGEIKHFSREFPNPTRSSCNYCRQLDHVVEDCPILIAKMQEKQPNPTQNVQRVKTKLRNVNLSVKVMKRSGMVTQRSKEELAPQEGVNLKEQVPLAGRRTPR